VRFVVDDAVEGAVEHGVYTQGEEMLVVRGEDAGVDDCAPWNFNALIDWLGGEDTSGADFIYELASLVEHECEDVLVVGDGDDGLEDELAVADHGGAAGTVVGVLPADAVILLMDADDVGHLEWIALRVVENGREVLDAAETIASELEVVSHDACAAVTKIESCLLVEWVAWISVWDVHVRKGQAIEEWTAIVVDIIEDHAFTEVEADLEVPLLPGDCMALLAEVGDCETCSFWLENVQWLKISSKSLCLGDVLIRWLDLVWAWRFGGSIFTSWKEIDSGDCPGLGGDDWRNAKRHRIVARILLRRVVWISEIEEALEHALIVSEKALIETIGSYDELVSGCRKVVDQGGKAYHKSMDR
jgi:hypothetical protein